MPAYSHPFHRLSLSLPLFMPLRSSSNAKLQMDVIWIEGRKGNCEGVDMEMIDEWGKCEMNVDVKAGY